MDVRCPKCGEPWDLDSIHDRVQELNEDYPPTNFDEVARAFRAIGCKAMGESCAPNDYEAELRLDQHRPGALTPAEAAAALYELLGDDMDGAAAMLEDLGL